MFHVRLAVFCLMLFGFFATGLAQRPGPQFWRRLNCEPLEPRTKLEALEMRHASILFKGFTRITTVDVRDVRVDALEMRDLSNNSRAAGVVVVLRESGESGTERPRESRAFIDYEEIDPVIDGIDALAKANESMTKLAGFEAQYRTIGDLEFTVFRQTRSGVAVTISSGICDQVAVALSLDDLARLRAMITEAKAKLDQIK